MGTATGIISKPARAVTATTTVSGNEEILVDATSGAITITGPVAGTARRWGVKKTDATTNTVTINYTNSGGTVVQLLLTAQDDAKTFEPIGTGYIAVATDRSRAGDDVRYGRTLPTYANVRNGSFDQRATLYNGASKLLTFRGKLGLAATGTGLCHIGVVGDSIAIGYAIEPKYSWPNLLQQSVLPLLGFPSGGEVAYCQAPGNATDSRMTYTGTGTNVYNGLSRLMTGAGSAQFASTVAGTIAEFQFLAQVGTVTLAIDGAAPGAVTIVNGGSGVTYSAGTLTFASNTYAHTLIRVTGLTSATHTLKATWASGTVQVERFAVTLTSGVLVENMGISGSRAVEWTGAPNYRDSYYTPAGQGQSDYFDLLITQLGINDADGASGTQPVTSIAAFKTAMTVIATGNGPGFSGPTTADKLLIGSTYNSANSAAAWEPYLTAHYDLSDTLGIPLVDLAARYTSTPPTMMFADGTHPSRAGAYRIATDLGRAIAG